MDAFIIQDDGRYFDVQIKSRFPNTVVLAQENREIFLSDDSVWDLIDLLLDTLKEIYGMATQTVQLLFLSNECDVEFEYSPAVRGRFSLPNGDPGYPDEEEEFRITSIVAHYDDNATIELLPLLSEAAIMDAEEAVREVWKEDFEPMYADEEYWEDAA